jgi:hypothetical protein
LIWIKGADATHVTVAAMGLQDRLFIALIVLAMLGSVALVAVVVLPR